MARMVAGRLNKQIAGELGTSEATVKTHRKQVMAKMRAESLADLIRIADQLGLLKVVASSPKVVVALPKG